MKKINITITGALGRMGQQVPLGRMGQKYYGG